MSDFDGQTRADKPVCLTIAGSDSGGGAGIQADIKAMQANGVYAASVITAVTAQNTVAVVESMDLPISIIEAQMDAVCSDLRIEATKTGMLSSAAIISVVSERIRRHGLVSVVVDPVMISKSGFALLSDDAVSALVDELLPLAELVTPNAHEAERLTGIPVVDLDGAKEAARLIHRMGPANVLVKGGHVETGDQAIDIFFDGVSFEGFASERIDTKNTHGTGCTYSSAIAANLALGYPMRDAIRRSKTYLTEAIRHGLDIGRGHGPTDHFFFLDQSTHQSAK